VETLQQFDFRLIMHYIKGKENVIIDVLLTIRQCHFHGKKIMMEDINKYYLQNEWFKKPYENLLLKK